SAGPGRTGCALRSPVGPSGKEVYMLFVSRVLALGLAVMVAAQAEPVEPPSRSFVGELAGGPRSARIALVAQGNDVVAYGCSQDKEFNQAHPRWYEGSLKEGRLAITLDGHTLTARIEGNKVEGNLVGPDRKTLTFTATRTVPGTLAGLYRAEDKLADDVVVL